MTIHNFQLIYLRKPFTVGCEDDEDTLLEYKYDKGKDFDWSIPMIQVPEKASEWLEEKLKEGQKSTFHVEENELGLPKRSDGSFYELDSLQDDQKDIVAYCLNHLKKWIEGMKEDGTSDVEPLHLTVKGVAGSGKSTFINTLVTAIRRMFQHKQSVVVCGPTGSAAFNAGGVTCHYAFSLPRIPELGDISEGKLKWIRQHLDWIIALIIDE